MFTSVLPAINQSTTPHPAAAGAVSAIRPQPEATAAVARATGPRTAEGKARSSRNAVRHGLLSASKALLPDEDPEDWADFLQDGLRLLAPVGRLEIAVAERIAHLHWRLARVPTVEVEAMQGREDVDNGLWLDDTPLPPGVPEPPPLPPISAGPDTKALANLQRYEAHMCRDITRAMQQLRELKAERRAAAEAAPALGARTSCPPRPFPYEPCPAADLHSDPCYPTDPSDPAVPPRHKLPNEVVTTAPQPAAAAVRCHREATTNESMPEMSGSTAAAGLLAASPQQELPNEVPTAAPQPAAAAVPCHATAAAGPLAAPPQPKLPNELPTAARPGTAVPERCPDTAVAGFSAVSGSLALYTPSPSYATVIRNLEVALRARLQRGEPVAPPEEGCDCPCCSMVRSLLAEANSEICQTNSAPPASVAPTTTLA